jgi:DnaJ domain
MLAIHSGAIRSGNQLIGLWPAGRPRAMTYYEILEVDSNASTEEIERAFRVLARRVHPDLNAGDPGRAGARMKQLNEIRDTLTDPLLRAGYDERLRLEDRGRQEATTAPASQDAPPRAAPGGFPWIRGALLAGCAALVGTAIFLASPPSPTAPPPGAAPGEADAAPVLAAPRGPARAPDPPVAPTSSWRPRKGGRGVVRLGSSADDVMRVFGPPDRIDVGKRAGDAVFVYGALRLELRSGRVTGGDAAGR